MRHATVRFCRAILVAALALLVYVPLARGAPPAIGDYLRACGIRAEDFARISDDRQVADEELDVIRRIAVRLRDCPAHVLHEMMAIESLPRPEEARAARGRPVQLRGRVESIEPATAMSADSVGGALWCCTIASSDRPHRAAVYLAELPDFVKERPAERSQKYAGQAVAVEGLFLKYAPGVKDEQVPVIVAPRLKRVAAGPLGELDFDAGLFDGVVDNAPLTTADSGAFHRLLALAKTTDPAALRREAATLDPAAAARMMHDPAAEHGRLYRVAGIARRVVQVPIDDPALAASLGADYYYELDVLSDALQDNPLVFCTLELPKNMPLGQPVAYGESVEVAGFFFKTWRYPVPLTAEERAAHPTAGRAFQTAPLLIGPAPRWMHEPPAEKNASAWIIGGVVVLVVTGLGLLLLHLRQSDQEFSRYVRQAFQPDRAGESGWKA